MSPRAARQIRICRLETGGWHEVLEIPNTAQGLYDALDGYAEPIRLPKELYDRHLVGLVDEDGLARALPLNPYSPRLGLGPLVGPVLIARSSVPDFVSLTDDDVAAIEAWLGR